MTQRERGSRWIVQPHPRSRTTILLLSILASSLLVVAPHAAHSHTPAPEDFGTIGATNRSLEWTGPPKSTTEIAAGTPKIWDNFYLTVDSPGNFGVRIVWEDPHHDFNVYVYRGHIEPTASPPFGAQVGRSERREGTNEAVDVVNTETTEYTVRVVYFRVLHAGYRGSATFFDSNVVHAQPPLESLEFGPATIVSAHFLGTEPMVTMERHIPSKEYGEPARDPINADRIFVDWPLTSRGQIGQVSRSQDGGDSFRLLFDPDCPERSRPGCLMGGGSDTMTEVDLVDGTLYFADQAAVIGAESLASSTDHGDTFPDLRQFAITSEVTATDRQWLAPLNGVPITLPSEDVEGRREIKAFLAYHVPLEGQYFHGIDQDGVPIPQPVPQIPNVIQSGHPRVDTSDGPGQGWIYQPFEDIGTESGKIAAVKVATAPGHAYQNPAKWMTTTITDVDKIGFTWLDIDAAGNAYLVWVTGDSDDDKVPADVYLSVSPIDHELNNPDFPGGRPGTFWTPGIRISPDEIETAVFAQVVAGDEGRVAVSYLGTEKWAGAPDNAFSETEWHAYASIVTDALGDKGAPTVYTGRVSHRPVHLGKICSGGLLSCMTADRSLADMIDIGVDGDGRVGVVFADNNNSLPWQDEVEKARPFAHFAKLSSGPSLFAPDEDSANEPWINVSSPVDGAEPELKDATWPNTANGRYLPAMDLLRTRLSLEGDEEGDEEGDVIVARLELPDPIADPQMMSDALRAFDATSSRIHPPERLHYMVRFATDDDIYHLSMDYRPPTGSQTEGVTRFFGGRLDANDALRVGDSESLTLVGAAYRADENVAVKRTIDHDTNTLVLSVPASHLCGVDGEDFCVADGTKVFSVTGFAMAGPAEEDVAVLNPMRTVDATPPFDMTLSPEPVQTTLTYTGDSEGKVGGTVAVSALLATADGSPLAGQTISFSRGGKEATAVTSDGSDGRPVGVASTTLHITGPPGSSLPVVVTFDGDASFLPVSIEAPFTAHTGSTKTAAPRGAI